MKKINSGLWPSCNPTQVAAGIRGNILELSKVLPSEVIFVAITGRDGRYREKFDVDKLLHKLGLEVPYQHNVTNEGKADALLYGDEGIHSSIFDRLLKYMYDVFPVPNDDVSEEGDERPF